MIKSKSLLSTQKEKMQIADSLYSGTIQSPMKNDERNKNISYMTRVLNKKPD